MPRKSAVKAPDYFRKRKSLGDRAAELIRSGKAKPLTTEIIQSRLDTSKK